MAFFLLVFSPFSVKEPMENSNDSNEQMGTPSEDVNTSRPRQPLFNLPTVMVVIVAACTLVHLLRSNFFSVSLDQWVLINFAFFPIRYTAQYFTFDMATILSPFSYTLLHGSWGHLAMNMIWLVIFGAPVAYRIGSWRSVLFWLVTGLGAVILHTALYYGSSTPLIGASGAVSGFLGAAARFGFRANRRNPREGLAGHLYGPLDSLRQRGVLPFLLVWMIINFAFGSGILGMAGDASIAWEAHIGGLVTGYFLIGLLDRKSYRL